MKKILILAMLAVLNSCALTPIQLMETMDFTTAENKALLEDFIAAVEDIVDIKADGTISYEGENVEIITLMNIGDSYRAVYQYGRAYIGLEYVTDAYGVDTNDFKLGYEPAMYMYTTFLSASSYGDSYWDGSASVFQNSEGFDAFDKPGTAPSTDLSGKSDYITSVNAAKMVTCRTGDTFVVNTSSGNYNYTIDYFELEWVNDVNGGYESYKFIGSVELPIELVSAVKYSDNHFEGYYLDYSCGGYRKFIYKDDYRYKNWNTGNIEYGNGIAYYSSWGFDSMIAYDNDLAKDDYYIDSEYYYGN